ncbi:MAG: transcription termination/antitermination protein NusA [Deltaproteobacteria bacterium]|nr:transcription termination/antitermination protein NusA [Deltaproteobacteria bacterium]
MSSELARVIEQVEKDKGIQRAVIVEALESALLMAAKKKYGFEKEIEAHFNPDLGEIELFQFKTVVETVKDPDMEIIDGEARRLDPDVAIGDSIGIKLNSSEFGRIAAQTAKQVIIQKVRDAERDIIYNEFNVRKGEIVSGVCRRIEKGCVIVDLGRTDAILPAREQIPGEHFRAGDRVLGFLIDVQQTPRGPKIVLSRTCSELLVQLFKQEVPEVNEGIVQIRHAAREPGVRAKIAVSSSDPDVDPVGACVGVKGARVQNVVQELRGEKIDIVPWDADETRFVCNALAPAEVAKVLLDDEGHAMEIVVADNQLSLAIGKRGQNVKLASLLTGWKLDIVSETKMTKRLEDAKKLLMHVSGMNDTMAQSLYHFGYTVEQIKAADLDALAAVPGLNAEKAKELQASAEQLIESGKLKEIMENAAKEQQAQEAQAKLSTDQVFERLKAEVKAHEERSRAADAESKSAQANQGEQKGTT